MARNKVPTVHFRRRRDGKTDYRKRLSLLKSGKSRLVVRTTLKNIRAQIIEFTINGDKVIASAESKDLEKSGWNYSKSNLPAAYLVGLIIGKKAQEKKVKEAILDAGFRKNLRRSKTAAVLKGALDAGLNIPHAEDMFPLEERLKGKHIAEYAKLLKGDKEQYEKAFGACLKKGVNPEDIESGFAKVKEAILKA